MKRQFKRFILTWIILFLAIELIMSVFGIGKKTEEVPTDLDSGILIEATKEKFAIGKEVILKLENHSSEEVAISNCTGPYDETIETTDGRIVEANILKTCHSGPALDVFFYNTGIWEEVALEKIEVGEEEEAKLILASGEKGKYSLLKWNYDLFNEIGRYKAVLTIEDIEYSSPEFTIKERGLLKRGWDTFFHKPIYNLLIFFTKINPTHSLGVAIVLLTFLMRLILLVPSSRALRSQKRMQEIQPRIQEIQRKYKGNQEKIAMETMAVWKNAKTNPLGSCLPMLIQFPILIALYFSVREVAVAENSYMLYEFQQNFDFGTIQTMFLGILELAEREQIFLPITIGILQFAQMKLTFSLKKSKTPEPKEKKKDGMPDMSSMNKSMTYAMPLMIAFFTASLPAGVGLYWGTSTLFGIGQTIAINREKPEDKKNKSNNSSEVTVKVVEKNEKEKYLPKAKSKKKK